MANTYSSNLRLIIQTNGENAGTWGTYTNTNIATLLEQAITGVGAIAVSGSSNYTLTTANGASDESRNAILNITGTLTAAINIVCPTVSKTYIIKNGTTGGFAITLKTSAGTGISVPNGGTMYLYCDGTNVVNAITINAITGGSIDNTPIGATTPSTGAFTTLSASSTVTLSGGTANGVGYLNASKVFTTGSALTFNGSTLGITGSGLVQTFTSTGDFSTTGTSYIRWYDSVGAKGYIGYAGTASTLTLASSMNGLDLQSNSYITFSTPTEQMRLTSTGLGIGTSSPAAKLDVNGAAQAVVANGTSIYARSGASGSYTSYSLGRTSQEIFISIAGAANNFISGSAAGDLTINNNTGNVLITAGGSATQFYLNTSGNLGLGATPSAWSGAVPSVLQVGSGASIYSTNVSQTSIQANTYYNGGFKYMGTGYATQYQQGSGQHQWLTAPSGTAGNAITFTQAMTLDASGNLGLGTTSPAALNAGGGYLTLNNASSGGGWNLQFNGTNVGYGIGTSSGLRLDTFTGYPIIFGTQGTERARIDSSGNVGIGTSSPQSRFNCVSGSDNLNSFYPNATSYITGPDVSVTTGATVQINANDPGVANIGGSLAFGGRYTNSGDTRNVLYGLIKGAKENSTNGNPAGYLALYTNSSTAPTERARIDSSGNLLVGTTSTISGARTSIINVNAGQAGLGIGNSTGASLTTAISFRNSNGEVGTIQTNGSATSYNTSSDQRLKTNIQPAESAIQSILDFPVAQFDWIADGSHQDFGAIAQKVLPIIPEMVSVPNDPEEMMGIDWSKAVPRLIKTIQEQQAIIEQLTTRIATLEAK